MRSVAMGSVLLATSGYDHTIRFWEAASGNNHKTLQHPDSQVNSLEISPDKRCIAAGGNPSLRVYDIESGSSAVTSYDGHTNNITAVGFQRDGKWMFTGSEDGSIKIWDLRAPGCQREFESGCAINTVELMPSQGEVVSGDRQGSIRCWDLGQNSCSNELGPDGTKPIRSLSVARDGSMLAAANDQGTCFLWRLGRGGGEERIGKFEPLQKLQARARGARATRRMAQTPDMPPSPQAHATYLIKCLFSPDGTKLATMSSDQSIKIWSTHNNFECEKTLNGHQRWVWDAVFSADSAYLVTASSDQTARLWDVSQARALRAAGGGRRGVPPDPHPPPPSPFAPSHTFYSTRPTPTLEPTLPAPPPRLPSLSLLAHRARPSGTTRATTRLSPASLSTTAHRLAEADARANFVAHSALGLGRRGGSPFRLRLRPLRIQEIRRPLPEADARIRLAACAGNPEEARALRKSELGRDRPEAKSARGSGSSTDRIALRTFAPCSFRQGCLYCLRIFFDTGTASCGVKTPSRKDRERCGRRRSAGDRKRALIVK